MLSKQATSNGSRPVCHSVRDNFIAITIFWKLTWLFAMLVLYSVNNNTVQCNVNNNL